jgi:hypothetical protein
LRKIAPERFNAAAPSTPTGPVKVSVLPNAASLGADGTARLSVLFEMKSPWHVALPGAEGVIPMRIDSATPGVTVEAQWPEGDVFDGPGGSIRVLEGGSRVPVLITRTDASVSTLQLSISWQACDDRMCLRPATKTIAVQLGAAN